MKILTFLFVLFSLFFGAVPGFFAENATGQGATIKVSPDNLRNQQGHFGCVLFRGGEGFPNELQKAYRKKGIQIQNSKPVCRFENVPPGVYAISVLHDENSNKKLDKNLFGVPQEGWAVSNNAEQGIVSPPDYEDARFEVESGDITMNLQLNY